MLRVAMLRRLCLPAATVRSRTAMYYAPSLPRNTRALSTSSQSGSKPAILTDISSDMLVSLSMGWGTESKTNEELIDNLKENSMVAHEEVISAMKSIDRADFVVGEVENPYEDKAHPLGKGVVTWFLSLTVALKGYGASMSRPMMHAKCLDVLAPIVHRGARTLDVGCGSGYVTACFSVMVGAEGQSVGMEHIPELAEMARNNLDKYPSLKEHTEIIVGNGYDGAGSVGGQFNAIHVGASCPTIPEPLVDQLAPGGWMLIPIGVPGNEQQLVRVIKSQDGKVYREEEMSVMFAPLNRNRDMQTDDPVARLEKIQEALEDWRDDWHDEHGKRPTREELQSDPVAGALFKEFRALRRRTDKWGVS